MMTENNYDFLKRMRVIHKPDRRDFSLVQNSNEIVIDNSWKIVIPETASKLIRRAADDLQDYLFTSMNVSIVIETGAAVKAAATILLTSAADYKGVCAEKPVKENSFDLEVSEDGILVCGYDDRSVLFGSLHLEDLMNFREAPYLEKVSYVREKLTRMRSVHSGSGIDDYPDWQLNAILHAGFTAIDLFVKGIDTTTKGYCNINDVIDRANSYGLDVVMYNYIHCYKHPDDEDAEEFFDNVYGSVIKYHPGFKSIHMVGESLEFPSHDPHTTGKRHRDSDIDGIPDTRPSPGWYPCCDYPAYVKRIADAVHKVNPDIEIIFNTYNWGWTPLEVRRKFLEGLPKDVTVQITYDIFRQNTSNGLHRPTMDYSISAADPGYYFTSEAEAAAEVGIKRIRCTSNLAGASWDFGPVPYVPVPQRWARRMMTLKHYLKTCNVSSFYDNHHYGWWPNPCNDLAKEIFASNGSEDVNAILLKVAARDYGKDVADKIVEAWQIWSNAMDHYVGTNEDQYGPWRTGPSYPFIFQPNLTRTMAQKEMQFPTAAHAHFGYRIIKTLYQPYENINQSPAPLRYPHELKELGILLQMWEEGLAIVENALDKMPENKKTNGIFLRALGKFIRNSIKTTLNMKNWWILNMKLQIPSDRETMLGYLDQIEALAAAEIENVKDTVEVVRTDSRIGWEPSMEYVCDEWHLNWKLRQMESMLREVADYRTIIQL